MKNGLLLTLKQLIKLGVIKLKKKRKNKNKRLQQIDAFEKGLTNAVPFNPQNKRYSDFVGSSSPPQMMPYTDNLRLRDSNDNFNTRLLEYKNDLTNQKLLLNDQRDKQRELENDVDIGRQIIMRELRPITYDYGYVNDDEVDVAETYGSDSFEPQTRREHSLPETRGLQLHSAQPTRYSAIQDYEDEDEGIISREELLRRKREEQNAKSFESPFKDNLAKEENFAEDDSEPIGKPFGLLAQPSDDEGEAEHSTPQNPTIRRINENKKYRPTFIESKEDNEEKVTQQNEEEKAPMNFPKEKVPKHDNFPFSPERIPYARTKPSVAEVQQWREWYLQLGFKDPTILRTNTRSSYIKPIQAKLLDEYKKLRGDKDPSILRSKDPRIIYKAVKQRLAGVS
jgi:hypothetical protein